MNQPREWWAELTTAHQHTAKVLGDVSDVLARLVPRVVECRTMVLDANGQATGQERLPYRALAVDSMSAATLTIANQPLGTLPGSGPGVGFVRPGGIAVLNISGYAWSIYGGNPGDLVTVTVYGNAQHPAAAGAAPVQVVSNGNGFAVTSPGAGATIASIPAASLTPGPWDLTATMYIDGTVAAATDDDNMTISPIATAGAQKVSVPSNGQLVTYRWRNTFNGTFGASVKAIGAGTVGAVYHATLIATSAW